MVTGSGTGAQQLSDALSAARKLIISYPSRRRAARAYRKLVACGIRLEPLLGATSGLAIPVIMCMWRRPERMKTILRMLDDQSDCPPIRLVLWNNNSLNSAKIRSDISGFSAVGSLESIELYESAVNVGGIGRFLAAREVRKHSTRGLMIMLDDDQDVSHSFVRDLAATGSPRTISGVWAWRIHSGYWDRTQVVIQGGSADYVGTGGCVWDSSLIDDRRLLDDLPSRFMFMEDIWMSRFAAQRDWNLRMVDTPVSFVLADLDQGHDLHRQKTKFYEWLVSRS
ncbi:hypothetical protein SAMN06296378_0084 [Salinibacterium xinjiangense]|uniref:Glycosyl transferase family 2 n=2 Tax=Salinibacterium xinjiangense TaxID=386302 RepID=A0A2C8Y6G2_9MICO|nr:hypothetical protein SAMN06296378_0084 [Salinibacterium xinjiangense]